MEKLVNYFGIQCCLMAVAFVCGWVLRMLCENCPCPKCKAKREQAAK